MEEAQQLYAVATGDVVDSSRLPPEERRRLAGEMRAAGEALAVAFPEVLVGEVDRFRGDGWQILLASPSLSLRAVLHYRADLRARMESHSFDVRAALAVGTVDFVPDGRVSQGDGEAFRLSGGALDAMRSDERLAFHCPEHPDEAALQVVVRLVDALAVRWSDRQARAITGALRGWSQDGIGRELWRPAVTQQAVQQHLERAGWSSVEGALEFFEEAFEAVRNR